MKSAEPKAGFDVLSRPTKYIDLKSKVDIIQRLQHLHQLKQNIAVLKCQPNPSMLQRREVTSYWSKYDSPASDAKYRERGKPRNLYSPLRTSCCSRFGWPSSPTFVDRILGVTDVFHRRLISASEICQIRVRVPNTSCSSGWTQSMALNAPSSKPWSLSDRGCAHVDNPDREAVRSFKVLVLVVLGE